MKNKKKIVMKKQFLLKQLENKEMAIKEMNKINFQLMQGLQQKMNNISQYHEQLQC